MSSDVSSIQKYQFIVEKLVEQQMISRPRQTQFSFLNEAQLLKVLLPSGPASLELLVAQRLQYASELRFPCADQNTVTMSRLRFANAPKEFRSELMTFILTLVKEIIGNLEKQSVDAETQKLASECKQYFEDNMSDENLHESIMNDELMQKFSQYFPEEKMGTIQAQMFDLTSKYRNVSVPNLIMELNNDPRFKEFVGSLSEVLQGQTPEQRNELFGGIQNDPNIKEQLSNLCNVGSLDDPDMSNVLMKAAANYTKPKIDDSDPLALSPEDFSKLCEEMQTPE